MSNIKLDLNDLLLIPAVESTIESRKTEIDPYYKVGNKSMLPLFAAPMDTVINEENFTKFLDNGIGVCGPRKPIKKSATPSERMTVYDFAHGANYRNVFSSESLDSFKERFFDQEGPDQIKFVLIDIANGHMKKLREYIEKSKTLYPSMKLMVGNIANPRTFLELSKSGADYIRVGIGNGNACLTTQQTAIGYPMASLIQECKEIAEENSCTAKIVADGGMKNFSDIIKALALGADYVMVGSILNKTLESAGQTYFHGIKVGDSTSKWLFDRGYKLDKKFRGMSTKEVQKDWGKAILTTSEGIVKKQRVEYTIQGWTKNFTDYLKSAMSYTNSRNLKEFIGKVNLIQISEESKNRFNK